jgi:hypothetical protein
MYIFYLAYIIILLNAQWAQYLPRQLCTHFIYNSYSVCFYYKKWWLSDSNDSGREETAI